MANLKTSYMGVDLANPVVAAASPLGRDVDAVRKLEDAGAGAIVLHSLFEEQVTLEEEELDENLVQGTESYAEALSYFPDIGPYRFAADDYVEHVRRVRDTVGIPVFGSLNGVSKGGWVRYAKLIEEAGADGIELNVYFLSTDPAVSAENIEEIRADLVRAVAGAVSIPVAVKLGPWLDAVPNTAARLEGAGAKGLVLFNRFYQPDIDPEALAVKTTLQLSTRQELPLRLRWTAILRGRVDLDLAVSGGIHTAVDVVKSLLAGATVATCASVLLDHGPGYVSDLIAGLETWLDGHGYDSADAVRGLVSQETVAEPAAFERAHYMKVLGSWNG
ncbi:MAG: dihydroorotate dehydrogenase-like protein [Candidatus Krumholzibacteriota bacterium]|nr:dihydroorotate dehydrogenase-like protein [Candidatus Krumholzibacteriota bacterium]